MRCVSANEMCDVLVAMRCISGNVIRFIHSHIFYNNNNISNNLLFNFLGDVALACNLIDLV